MSLSNRFTISTSAVVRVLDEQTMILDLSSGMYYGLDNTGSRVWQQLEAGLSVDEICNEMLTEYDTIRETLERDVLALIDELLDRKLIENVDPQNRGA